MVLASHDPRAQHLYAPAGFTPRPTVAARGVVGRRRLPLTRRPREGGIDDVGLCDLVDRESGAPPAPPTSSSSCSGGRASADRRRRRPRLCPRQPDRLATLCATDGATAAALLAGVLAHAGGGELEFGWLTEGQGWRGRPLRRRPRRRPWGRSGRWRG